MRTPPLHIENPCHESWDAMSGGAERRFCGVCQTHVHNLSAMAMDDAAALLRASEGRALCVRYHAEPDGSLRFRDLVPTSRLTRGLARAAVATALLAACQTQEPAPLGAEPAPRVEAPRAAAIEREAAARSSVGCDVQPLSFMTLHLPPGHPLCAGTDDSAGVDEVSAPVVALAPEAPAAPPAGHATPWPALSDDEPSAPSTVEDHAPHDPVAVARPGARAPHVAAPPPFAPPPPPFAPPQFAPPPPRFAPPPPPQFAPPPPPQFAPPPPPQFAPPPPPHPPYDEPLMGSVTPRPEVMGRIAPASR